MKQAKDERKAYVCSNCGYESLKWFGRCPQCDEWNTAVEVEGVPSGTPSAVHFEMSIAEVGIQPRVRTGMGELDRVLGGGLTPGSVVLLAGGPGMGKSTLLLEYASALAGLGKVYYVSGEESVPQMLSRVKRLGIGRENLFLSSTVAIDSVLASMKNDPIAIVFDSIQTVHTSGMNALTGSIPQMRQCTMKIVEYAKSSNVPVFIIGHVTKEGGIAGPMVLEHMVDSVLYLEGEVSSGRRILRAIKNRFGPTDEIAVYEMRGDGMAEISDPSSVFMDVESEEPGNALSVVVEGSRSLMINVQALTTPNNRSNPVRIARGFETTRLLILSALVSNHLGVSLENRDAYLSVLGGLKITDPGVDLAVIAALFSSAKSLRFAPKTTFIGEVGLDGRIRGVSQMPLRIAETKRMGIKNIITSYQVKERGVKGVRTLKEAMAKALTGDEKHGKG